MKTILITGINGFLGSNLAKRFVKNNYKIIGTEFSLDNLFRIKNYDFLVYSSDIESIQKLFADHKIDIVIHTATFYGRNNEEIRQLLESNFLSPFNILDYAINNNVELFINTDTVLEKFTSAYVLTKKQFLDWLIFRSNEIKIVNIQLEHFYGPGASKTNFITAMIDKLEDNIPSIDLTQGEQRRDFVYYQDVVDAYELIVNSIDKLNNQFNQFVIGSGKFTAVRDLVTLLKELTNSESVLNFGALPYRDNELMESQSNLEAILKLGWNPKTSIHEGLLKTIRERIK